MYTFSVHNHGGVEGLALCEPNKSSCVLQPLVKREAIIQPFYCGQFAAITSYYRSFTMICCERLIIPDFGLADNVYMRAIMNEGTNSVAVSFAQAFATGNDAKSQTRKISGGGYSEYNLSRRRRDNTIVTNFRDCMIVPEKSVVQLKIPIPLARDERISLIDKTKRILGNDSLLSAKLFMGMALELTDPWGEVSFLSSAAVEGEIFSDPNKWWRSTESSYGKVIRMPPFGEPN